MPTSGNAKQAAESFALAAQMAPPDAEITDSLKMIGEPLPLPVPLTVNEMALMALLMTSPGSAVVGSRHRLFARNKV